MFRSIKISFVFLLLVIHPALLSFELTLECKSGSLPIPQGIVRSPQVLEAFRLAPVQNELKTMSLLNCQHFLGFIERIHATENLKQPWFQDFFSSHSLTDSVKMLNLLSHFNQRVTPAFLQSIADHFVRSKQALAGCILPQLRDEYSTLIKDRYRALFNKELAQAVMPAALAGSHDIAVSVDNQLKSDVIVYIRNAASDSLPTQGLWSKFFNKKYIEQKLKESAFSNDSTGRIIFQVAWSDAIKECVVKLIPLLTSPNEVEKDIDCLLPVIPPYATFFEELLKVLRNFRFSQERLKFVEKCIKIREQRFAYYYSEAVGEEFKKSITPAQEQTFRSEAIDALKKEYEGFGEISPRLQSFCLRMHLSPSAQCNVLQDLFSEHTYVKPVNDAQICDLQSMRDLTIVCGPPSDPTYSLANALNCCSTATGKALFTHQLMNVTADNAQLRKRQSDVQALQQFCTTPCTLAGYTQFNWFEFFNHQLTLLKEFEPDILCLKEDFLEMYVQQNDSKMERIPYAGPLLVQISHLAEDVVITIKLGWHAAAHATKNKRDQLQKKWDEVKIKIPYVRECFNDDSEILELMRPVLAGLTTAWQGAEWCLFTAVQCIPLCSPVLSGIKSWIWGASAKSAAALADKGYMPSLNTVGQAVSMVHAIDYLFSCRFSIYQRIKKIENFIQHLKVLRQGIALLPADIRATIPSLDAAFIPAVEAISKVTHKPLEQLLEQKTAHITKHLSRQAAEAVRNNLKIIVSGHLLPIYAHISDNKDHLFSSLLAVGELDARLSLITLMYKWSAEDKPWCWAHYNDDRTKPVVCAQDMWSPTVKNNPVLNSVSLGEGPRVQVITGPNARGKSTSMRALAYNVLLAQSFGIVPARSCTLTPFSKIAVYMNIKDDPVQNLSLFQASVKRAQELFNYSDQCTKSTQPSLMLFDELFNGTNPTMGETLSYGLLSRLKAKSMNVCLASTHYQFSHALQKEFPLDFKFTYVSDGSDNKIKYRLYDGIYSKSNAFEESNNSGLAQEVLDSAARYLKKNIFKPTNHADDQSPLLHANLVSSSLHTAWGSEYRMLVKQIVDTLESGCSSGERDSIAKKLMNISSPHEVIDLIVCYQNKRVNVNTLLTNAHKQKLEEICAQFHESQWKQKLRLLVKEVNKVAKQLESGLQEAVLKRRRLERKHLCSLIAAISQPHELLSLKIRINDHEELLINSCLMATIEDGPGKLLKELLLTYDEELFQSFSTALHHYKHVIGNRDADVLPAMHAIKQQFDSMPFGYERFEKAFIELQYCHMSSVVANGLFIDMPPYLRNKWAEYIFGSIHTAAYIQHMKASARSSEIQMQLPHSSHYHPVLLMFLTMSNEKSFLRLFNNSAHEDFFSESNEGFFTLAEKELMKHILTKAHIDTAGIDALEAFFWLIKKRKYDGQFWKEFVQEKPMVDLWSKCMQANVHLLRLSNELLEGDYVDECDGAKKSAMEQQYQAIKLLFKQRYKHLSQFFNAILQPVYKCAKIEYDV